MLRRTVLKASGEPLLPDVAKGAWRIESRHLAVAVLWFGCLVVLLRRELGQQRSEVWNNIEHLRAEVRTEVQFLAEEVRASLAEAASCNRAIEAHAELVRGANAGREGAPPR